MMPLMIAWDACAETVVGESEKGTSGLTSAII